jgi:4'-phosphopantetheinyl transferase
MGAATSALESDWTPGPSRPLLRPGAVHVWRADLDALQHLAELLSPQELERAARIAGDRERRRWTSSRGALRLLLARYMGTEPPALRLALGAGGKPRVVDGELEFNLSHSGAVALFALAAEVPVGVDVELARPRRRDVAAIAQRTLGREQARRLRELDAAEREREFLRMWVRHEARLKCLAAGLRGAESSGAGEQPWVCELPLDEGAAAVASISPPSAIVRWSLAPAPRRS